MNEQLVGGKKRGRKSTKGGLGLTGAISTGLLLAAEELYRNSLKKHGKKSGGSGADAVANAELADVANLTVQEIMAGGRKKTTRKHKGGNATVEGSMDSRAGALLADFGKPLTTGGKKGRGRKHRGGKVDKYGNVVEEAAPEEAAPEEAAPEEAATEERTQEAAEERTQEPKPKQYLITVDDVENLDLENIKTQIRNIINSTVTEGGRRRRKHVTKKRGGNATQFDMNAIAAEAQKAAEDQVGGRHRKRHSSPKRKGKKTGGDGTGVQLNHVDAHQQVSSMSGMLGGLLNKLY